MTTLDPQFLRAICLLVGFKPTAMLRAQAALLLIGLRQPEFTAADLPGEIAGRHTSGAATGALIAQGLLLPSGRIKSPNPNAKGRKVNLLRLASSSKARTWLNANRIAAPNDPQCPELPWSEPAPLSLPCPLPV